MNRYFRLLPIIAVFPLLSLMFTAPVAAQTDLQANKALAARFNEEIWNQGKVEVASEFIAPDFVAHFFGSPDEDWATYVTNTVTPIRAMFTNLNISSVVTIAENDLVASPLFWGGILNDEKGTPTKKQVLVSDIAFFRIKDGKIAEFWDGTNTLGFNQQIGVVPVEGAIAPEKPWAVTLGKTSSTLTEQRALLWDYFMAINGRNYSEFDRCLAENMVDYWAPSNFTVEGLKNIKETWTTIPLSHRIAPEIMVVEGDLAAAHFTMFPGSNPATVNAIRINLAALYRFDKGKIVNEWAVWDEFTAMQQTSAAAKSS